MTVKSARVQEIIKGDDVTLKHQVMKNVAYNAEMSREPVLVEADDIIKFFYALQDKTIDEIGFTGVAIGSYPTSEFNVIIPGLIPAAELVPDRGTSQFLSGEGLTVRAEITRDGGVKETHYLLAEVDIYERGFPIAPDVLILP